MKFLITKLVCLFLASQVEAHYPRTTVLLADPGCVPVAPPQRFVPAPSAFLSIQTQSVYSQQLLAAPSPLYGVGGCGTGLRVGVGHYGVRDALFLDRGPTIRVRTPGFFLGIR